MEDTGPRRIPSLKPSASPTPPEAIRNEGSSMKDFEILKLLGKGAYGKALLCRDRRVREEEDDWSS